MNKPSKEDLREQIVNLVEKLEGDLYVNYCENDEDLNDVAPQMRMAADKAKLEILEKCLEKRNKRKAAERKDTNGKQRSPWNGDRIVIPVSQIEFREGGNTIWIHGPAGGTVLRIKTMGVHNIQSYMCSVGPCSHADFVTDQDISFCLGPEAEIE